MLEVNNNSTKTSPNNTSNSQPVSLNDNKELAMILHFVQQGLLDVVETKSKKIKNGPFQEITPPIKTLPGDLNPPANEITSESSSLCSSSSLYSAAKESFIQEVREFAKLLKEIEKAIESHDYSKLSSLFLSMQGALVKMVLLYEGGSGLTQQDKAFFMTFLGLFRSLNFTDGQADAASEKAVEACLKQYLMQFGNETIKVPSHTLLDKLTFPINEVFTPETSLHARAKQRLIQEMRDLKKFLMELEEAVQSKDYSKIVSVENKKVTVPVHKLQPRNIETFANTLTSPARHLNLAI